MVGLALCQRLRILLTLSLKAEILFDIVLCIYVIKYSSIPPLGGGIV